MKTALFLLAALVCFLPASSSAPIFPSFLEFEPFAARESEDAAALTPGQIRKCAADLSTSSWKFFRVKYLSDGLRVPALIGLPPNFDAKKKYPLLVFNRGGNRALGQLNICSLGMLSDFGAVLDESILLASQYRGSLGSEGRDEFGGKDLDDVLNLVNLTEGLEFVDQKNRFLVGWSRGGMMAYLTLKAGVRFNAAAIIAGSADLFGSEELRPEMKRLHQELIPQYERDREVALASRSALYWVDKINAPVLLVHGDVDWRVSVQNSLRMANALKKRKKPYRLIIYPGDDHNLTKSYRSMLGELRDWFGAYRKK